MQTAIRLVRVIALSRMGSNLFDTGGSIPSYSPSFPPLWSGSENLYFALSWLVRISSFYHFFFALSWLVRISPFYHFFYSIYSRPSMYSIPSRKTVRCSVRGAPPISTFSTTCALALSLLINLSIYTIHFPIFFNSLFKTQTKFLHFDLRLYLMLGCWMNLLSKQ